MADFEGRWSEAGGKVVLDLTRCGEGICGQRVEASGYCGRKVLTLAGDAPAAIAENSVRIQGEYDWSPHPGDAPHPAHVMADIRRNPDKGDTLVLLVWDRSVMRRGPALRLYLSKTGEAVCRSNSIS
jgi:hypothetical protein